MTPKIMDDWYWFLMYNWMRLFCPFDYMKEIMKVKKSRWKDKW